MAVHQCTMAQQFWNSIIKDNEYDTPFEVPKADKVTENNSNNVVRMTKQLCNFIFCISTVAGITHSKNINIHSNKIYALYRDFTLFIYF